MPSPKPKIDIRAHFVASARTAGVGYVAPTPAAAVPSGQTAIAAAWDSAFGKVAQPGYSTPAAVTADTPAQATGVEAMWAKAFAPYARHGARQPGSRP